MRKLLLIPLLFALPLAAQVTSSGVKYVASTPTGACSPQIIEVVASTGTAYTCSDGTWAPITGGGAGNPSGPNTSVQFDAAGVFGGDPTFTFNSSTKTVTSQNGTIGPLGTANSSANFNSGILQACASTWTGSAPTPDCWQFQVQPFTGPNPYSLFNLSHVGSSGGGQVVLPFTAFTNGFGFQAINNSGTLLVGAPLNMPSGNYQINVPGSPPAGSNTFLSCPLDTGTLYTCIWSTGGGGGSAFVTPQQFGGFGDAYVQPDGCTTTASSTNINCRDATFVSGDVGKQMWVPGAGASGVAYHGTITAVVDSSDVTVTPAPSTSVGYTVLSALYGHDDTVAVQTCMQYSADHGVQCVLGPIAPPSGGNQGYTGFLIGSSPGLKLPVNNLGISANVTGGNYVTNLFCEFNGDCVSLAAGPVQSAIVSNVALQGDPTQASARGFHFNAQAGPFSSGGLWNSTFTNILVNNFAQECMLSEGGGGPGYNFLLPNQIDTFIQFQCDGPNQSHSANLIKMTGQHAQILFENGQANGLGVSNYPNYLIDIDEKTSTLGDAPVDVKFIGYTMEVGQKGIYAGNGSNNIHFDSGYLEDVTLVGYTLLNSPGFTFNGNHIASTAYAGGAVGVGQLTGGSTASMRDLWVYGNAPAALAVCSGSNNSIDFAGDVVQAEPTNLLTTNCATATAASSSGNLTLGQGATTASISCTGGAVINLNAPGVQPGKTLTLYAPASGCQLATGGDIAFGNYTSPVTIPAGGSVTLTLLDSGVTFLVTDAPPPSAASPSFSALTAGTNTATGAFSTLGAWTFGGIAYFNSSSGAVPTQYGPGTTCAGNCTNIYDDGNFNFDGTANGNRGLFFKGNFANQFIAGFRRDGSSTVVANIGLDGTINTLGGVRYPTYIVSALPSVPGSGSTVVVTDATTFTPGTCTGGGSDTVLAISNGSAWVCQ